MEIAYSLETEGHNLNHVLDLHYLKFLKLLKFSALSFFLIV